LVRRSTADVDALIGWAAQAAAQIPWAGVAPGPRDWLVIPNMPPHPPLLFSMVGQYASLRAWLDGRPLTRAEVDAVALELAGAWWNARMTGDFAIVGDVLRDIVLWSAVARMRKRDREAVRAALVAKREAAAAAPTPPPVATPAPPPVANPAPATAAPPSPVTRSPRGRDDDIKVDFGPGLTEQFPIPPIPPFRLS
jgi:hypothetical protein